MAPKCTADIGNYPVYNNLPGALYFLKSFKCMFAAAHHQANDPPKIRSEENDRLKNCEPKL